MVLFPDLKSITLKIHFHTISSVLKAIERKLFIWELGAEYFYIQDWLWLGDKVINYWIASSGRDSILPHREGLIDQMTLDEEGITLDMKQKKVTSSKPIDTKNPSKNAIL